MLSYNSMIEDLKFDFEWQQAPRPLTDGDFSMMIKRAVRLFFSDINRPAEYDETLIITGEDDTYYDRQFNVNEIEYILILAKLAFADKIRSDLDGMTSYSTDALTVSGVADAWKNLNAKIAELQHERRIRFNKMTEYTLGQT